MKKLDDKGSLAIILLVVLVLAVVGGAGYYAWNKNQKQEVVSTQGTLTSQTAQTGVVAIPSNFTESTEKAMELKNKSNVVGVEYKYYTDVDTATIIVVMTRPVTSKDSSLATLNANGEATTFSKIEFPKATTEVAEAVTVKGDNAEGYLVAVSNKATNIYVSYIGAANSKKVALVSVRSPVAYKAKQQEVVQSLVNSLQL